MLSIFEIQVEGVSEDFMKLLRRYSSMMGILNITDIVSKSESDKGKSDNKIYLITTYNTNPNDLAHRLFIEYAGLYGGTTEGKLEYIYTKPDDIPDFFRRFNIYVEKLDIC